MEIMEEKDLTFIVIGQIYQMVHYKTSNNQRNVVALWVMTQWNLYMTRSFRRNIQPSF